MEVRTGTNNTVTNTYHQNSK